MGLLFQFAQHAKVNKKIYVSPLFETGTDVLNEIWSRSKQTIQNFRKSLELMLFKEFDLFVHEFCNSVACVVL